MVCRKNCSLGTQSSRSEDRAHRLRAGFPINVVAAEGCIGARALHRCPTNSWASMRMEGIYGILDKHDADAVTLNAVEQRREARRLSIGLGNRNCARDG